VSRAPTRAQELEYVTGGLQKILKGAVITGVKLGRLRAGDFAPPLLMSVRFPKPVKFRCDGQDYQGITTMDPRLQTWRATGRAFGSRDARNLTAS
jgi:hypothetical protein